MTIESVILEGVRAIEANLIRSAYLGVPPMTYKDSMQVNIYAPMEMFDELRATSEKKIDIDNGFAFKIYGPVRPFVENQMINYLVRPTEGRYIVSVISRTGFNNIDEYFKIINN
jgi:hypothetical protein